MKDLKYYVDNFEEIKNKESEESKKAISKQLQEFYASVDKTSEKRKVIMDKAEEIKEDVENKVKEIDKKESVLRDELSISRKLCNIQAQIQSIKKDKKSLRNSYASLDAIIETLKPLLTKNKLRVVHNVITTEKGTALKTSVQCCETGSLEYSIFPLSSFMERSKADKWEPAQYYGALLSYGRRYNLLCLFNLATEEDLDSLVR